MKKDRVWMIGCIVMLPFLLLTMALAQENGENDGSVANFAGAVDAFGYTITDSNNGSCAVQFVDISQTGAVVVMGDDESTISSPPNGINATIPLSPAFMFYGRIYTQVVMASNGYLSTDPADSGPDTSNDCPLPAVPNTPPSTTGGRFYPLHNDLVLDNGGAGLYQTFPACPRPDGNGQSSFCSVFQWQDAYIFGSVVTFTMQAILYHETGEIVYQYDGRNIDAGLSSTTGIQSSATDFVLSGAAYACNAANSIVPNSAVCMTPPTPNLTLSTTVGTNPVTCATSPAVRVDAETAVYYCFTATNTGTALLTHHTLIDSELGILTNGFPYLLPPGDSTFYLTWPVTVPHSIVNEAYRQANYNELTSQDTDKATVVVNGPEVALACNSPAVGFDGGLPANWPTLATINEGVVWGDLRSCGESNYTGHDGDALCSSSHAFGPYDYDAQVWSNPFSLPEDALILLNYWANYQDASNNDFLDLDISTNGGLEWENLLRWGATGDSHGGEFAAPGEQVSVDLSSYAGDEGILLRWHYYNNDPAGSNGAEGYAQVDELSLYCATHHLFLPVARK